MRGDGHKMVSFQTRRVGNSKAFKALHCAIYRSTLSNSTLKVAKHSRKQSIRESKIIFFFFFERRNSPIMRVEKLFFPTNRLRLCTRCAFSLIDLSCCIYSTEQNVRLTSKSSPKERHCLTARAAYHLYI